MKVDKYFSSTAASKPNAKAQQVSFYSKREVSYLEHIVSAAGVHPDPSKPEAVFIYPVSNNVKELGQFLRLANYYRQFAADYSKVAERLHGFLWDSKCQDALNKFKHRLLSPPILAFLDFSQQFLLYIDASYSTIGRVLSHNQDGKERVIVYWSRQLQKVE